MRASSIPSNSGPNAYSARMGRIFYRDYTIETNYEGWQSILIPLLFLIIVFFVIRYCSGNKKTLIIYTIIASTIYLIYFFWWLPAAHSVL